MSPRVLRTAVASALVAALAACGSGDRPSAQEERELEEAERMLDEAPENLTGIDENMLLDRNETTAAEPRDRSNLP